MKTLPGAVCLVKPIAACCCCRTPPANSPPPRVLLQRLPRRKTLVVRVKLQEVVSLWWDDEPEDLREDLRDELRGSHGIPQEVDRHMLLRVRRALDRPLSFPEKNTA